eukprot:TRINITY_DN36678_c0_g1_i1.p1 TRINITY_DN36678_c0_g1~~TRINITY_DN36678_c0_g1_i1.p1  ORF type:complete len:448 (-),score=11.24 TRINITY_DN36678_c0_g1_i1:108-1451(-)
MDGEQKPLLAISRERSFGPITHWGAVIRQLYGDLAVYSFRSPKRALNSARAVFDTLLPDGSLRAGVFNLCSATLGAGALSLPFAFSQAGWLTSFLLLALAGCATVYSVWLLVQVYELAEAQTYEQSVEELVGARLRHCVEAVTIIFCFGTAVAYIVAVGDILEPVLLLSTVWERRAMMAAFWFLTMLPPSMFREVNSLRFTSFVGVIAMAYLVLATIIFSLRNHSTKNPNGVDMGRFDVGLFQSLPIMLFSYTCQVNVFQIYDELDKRTPEKMSLLTCGSVAISFSIYLFMGFFGYLAFGNATQGNILNNFSFWNSDVMVMLVFVAITIAILVAFPLVIYPLRTSFCVMLVGEPEMQSLSKHFSLTLVLSSSTLVAALFVPGINIVFQFLGSLTSSLLCFLFPSYLAFVAGVTRDSWLHTLGATVLAVFGVCIAVGGTAITIAGLVH